MSESMEPRDKRRQKFEADFKGVDVSFARNKYSHAYENGALEIMWQSERDGLIDRLEKALAQIAEIASSVDGEAQYAKLDRIAEIIARRLTTQHKEGSE